VCLIFFSMGNGMNLVDIGLLLLHVNLLKDKEGD